MRKILLATLNPGKRNEIISALMPMEKIEFISLPELGISTPVDETGTTYFENAMIKAKEYYKMGGGLPVIAEDSGMEVSALDGELGVNTRGWGAGADAADEDWLAHFMERMKQENNRAARFVCHAIYMDESGYKYFEGECSGTITHEIEGPIYKGIPLSAVFKPLGADKVYSAMSEEEKNLLSHRGKAIKNLRNYLLKWWSQGESNPEGKMTSLPVAPATTGPTHKIHDSK